MPVDEHVIDLLPAYALDCLDEEEAVRVKEHLVECAACQAELLAYQDVADRLPLAVPIVEPPTRVKQGLMRRIQSQHFQEDRPSRPTWPQRIAAFNRRLSPGWSAVSLLLIVVLAASNLLLWRQVNRLSTAPSNVMHSIYLNGSEAAPGATGLLVISLDGRHGTLVVDELPELDDQQQYQLWLIDASGNRTSGAVFSVREGYGSVWVSSPQPLIQYTAFGVTIEPSGGSAAPTGERVLGGEL